VCGISDKSIVLMVNENERGEEERRQKMAKSRCEKKKTHSRVV
jgi:hypothetical protein